MSKIIIAGNPTEKRSVGDIPKTLVIKVAEFFSQTLQGEGVSAGSPAAFLRVKDCTLDCTWCDSTEVWRQGNSYSVVELIEMMEESGLVEDLRNGHHLVLTGGSPVKQQLQLAALLSLFQIRYNFIPYIEVENECVLPILPGFAQFISQWNNSPKLENSGMKMQNRYRPEVLKQASQLNNSWFKFVVSKKEDWDEIYNDFLVPGLIDRSQVIIMPCGASREELDKSRGMVADIAIRESVLYSDRQHIILWNKKTSV